MKLSIYAEWCKIFDEIESWEIGHIDEKILSEMELGTLEWIDGIAQRINLRLINLVSNRLEKLNNYYNKRLSVSYNPFDLTNILIIFRKELIFIKRLYSLPMLPEDVRNDLVKDVIDYAKKVQKNLEDNAKKDLSGELKRVVTGYRVDNI